MQKLIKPAVIAVFGITASACAYNPNTTTGADCAAIGAATGAASGLLSGGDNRVTAGRALAGGAAGAVANSAGVC
ncbi:hypothetical protein [Histidinibacterium aquaticum]|uniref:17 kDa surface antigen n=1 Tax=Histidinibacterium aquaticum TaxID=2613962 RepID=A0A5J5GNJ4_9RHOB|nr:hypothetical protein [Histidinibacterium aquaticum]KAA9009921.1 hypothetical protein F3S47_01235 [Histidinibacterium aquaticum]